METLSCHDAGLNCIRIIQEKTEDEIMGKAIEHAMKEHT
jgi:predicted small metal-binding protein